METIMRLPFTIEQFFEVFGRYNLAIWPAPIVAYGLGIFALYSAFSKNTLFHRILSGILALYWIWMGVVYHLLFFSPINPAARIFGVLFILQGVLFLHQGTLKNAVRFKPGGNAITVLGIVFIAYAMIVYPLLGAWFGHVYPRTPVFGVAPCPTTIFTFGILLMTELRIPLRLVWIPLLWSFVGMGAAVGLRVPQDYGLFIAGIVGTAVLLLRNRRRRAVRPRPAAG
jgi:hypothetical protein